jgi:hypothetical protein
MATTLFACSIYGANSNDWKTANGRTFLFNSGTVVVRPLDPSVVYSGVTCNAQIQLLPTAPSPIQPVYYTDRTVAQVQALANA